MNDHNINIAAKISTVDKLVILFLIDTISTQEQNYSSQIINMLKNVRADLSDKELRQIDNDWMPGLLALKKKHEVTQQGGDQNHSQ